MKYEELEKSLEYFDNYPLRPQEGDICYQYDKKFKFINGGWCLLPLEKEGEENECKR